jgi:hypothetical protein
LLRHIAPREICEKAKYDIDSLPDVLSLMIAFPVFLVGPTDHVSSFSRCLAAQGQARPDLLALKAISMMSDEPQTSPRQNRSFPGAIIGDVLKGFVATR